LCVKKGIGRFRNTLKILEGDYQGTVITEVKDVTHHSSRADAKKSSKFLPMSYSYNDLKKTRMLLGAF